MVRAFVSSVAAGLEATRTQIISDLQKAGYGVGAMERFGAPPTIPIDVCLREHAHRRRMLLIEGGSDPLAVTITV